MRSFSDTGMEKTCNHRTNSVLYTDNNLKNTMKNKIFSFTRLNKWLATATMLLICFGLATVISPQAIDDMVPEASAWNGTISSGTSSPGEKKVNYSINSIGTTSGTTFTMEIVGGDASTVWKASSFYGAGWDLSFYYTGGYGTKILSYYSSDPTCGGGHSGGGNGTVETGLSGGDTATVVLKQGAFTLSTLAGFTVPALNAPTEAQMNSTNVATFDDVHVAGGSQASTEIYRLYGNDSDSTVSCTQPSGTTNWTYQAGISDANNKYYDFQILNTHPSGGPSVIADIVGSCTGSTTANDNLGQAYAFTDLLMTVSTDFTGAVKAKTLQNTTTNYSITVTIVDTDDVFLGEMIFIPSVFNDPNIVATYPLAPQDTNTSFAVNLTVTDPASVTVTPDMKWCFDLISLSGYSWIDKTNYCFQITEGEGKSYFIPPGMLFTEFDIFDIYGPFIYDVADEDEGAGHGSAGNQYDKELYEKAKQAEDTNEGNAIQALGIIAGSDDDNLSEANDIDRAQAAIMILRALAGADKGEGSVEATSDDEGTGNTTEWTSKYTYFTYDKGWESGIGETGFSEEGLNDYAMTQMLLQALGYPTDEGFNQSQDGVIADTGAVVDISEATNEEKLLYYQITGIYEEKYPNAGILVDSDLTDSVEAAVDLINALSWGLENQVTDYAAPTLIETSDGSYTLGLTNSTFAISFNEDLSVLVTTGFEASGSGFVGDDSKGTGYEVDVPAYDGDVNADIPGGSGTSQTFGEQGGLSTK